MIDLGDDRMRAVKLIKISYILLFCVVIPLFLVGWSIVVDIPLEPVRSPILGALVFALGFFTMGSGIVTLWKRTGQPPMNAYPSKRLVKDGIYGIVPHPIYLGFTLACLGISVAFGSATGLYLTTPIVAIACIAIVLGHERPYLLKQFKELPDPVLNLGFLWRPAIRVLRLDSLWKIVLRTTEKLTNSWKEYRIGPLRIINHGIYAGLAAGFGALLVVILAGQEHIFTVIILMISSIVGSAIWAQMLEGSSVLLRPFGYYGGLFGLLIAGMALMPFESDMILVLIAFSCAGPFIQAIGRVRCLVQGCCHGRPCSENAGIRVRNEHSRVCIIDGLKGRPIYPTQLYSIIGNTAVGLFLIILWLLQAPLMVIGGLFLILTNAVRFIEEGYRGETQTKHVLSMPIYQWIAIGLFFAGMVIMPIRAADAPAMHCSAIGYALLTAGFFFLIGWFSLSMDFPGSKVRFSRLSG